MATYQTLPSFVFAIRDGATLRLPATDLTEAERIVLVASIARALDLHHIDYEIQAANAWAFSDL